MIKHLFLCLGFLALLLFSNEEPTPELRVGRLSLKPPDNIEFLTFGYNEVVADSLWLRVLQDFDSCGEEGAITDMKAFEEERLKFLSDHLTTAELQEITDKKWSSRVYKDKERSKCNKGWVYHMVKSIIKLSPDFWLAYLNGANMLSILVDDPIGAGDIYEKAMEKYPADWKLSYHAGYHYLYELRSPGRAANLFRNSVENGGPQWIYSLIGELYSKTGQAKIAKIHLEAFLKRNPDSRYSERIRGRLDEVNKILQNEKESSPYSLEGEEEK